MTAGALSVALIAWLAVAQYLGSANAYFATSDASRSLITRIDPLNSRGRGSIVDRDCFKWLMSAARSQYPKFLSSVRTCCWGVRDGRYRKKRSFFEALTTFLSLMDYVEY